MEYVRSKSESTAPGGMNVDDELKTISMYDDTILSFQKDLIRKKETTGIVTMSNMYRMETMTNSIARATEKKLRTISHVDHKSNESYDTIIGEARRNRW
jgi:hypothetical protein